MFLPFAFLLPYGDIMSHEKIMQINLEELVDQHARLREILKEIQCTLTQRRASCVTIVAMFSDLTDQIRSHFAHEENEGYFSEAVAQAPRLATQADHLLGQHVDLLNHLNHLHQLAQQGTGSSQWWVQITFAFDNFTRLFLEHEQQENDLVQGAYNEDIGESD